MRVKLLFFASLAERAGRAAETVDLPAGTTAGSLWGLLVEQRPALSGAARPAVALNGEIAGEDDPVGEGDEVAFLPPVSGG